MPMNNLNAITINVSNTFDIWLGYLILGFRQKSSGGKCSSLLYIDIACEFDFKLFLSNQINTFLQDSIFFLLNEH